MRKDGRETRRNIIVSINGAAALYVATRNTRYPRASERQLRSYLQTLRA